MTIAHDILQAVFTILGGDLEGAFTRAQARTHLAVPQRTWNRSYDPIFQGMRADQPGGAPSPGKYRGAFRRVDRGRFVLTEVGREFVSTDSVRITRREAVLDAMRRASVAKGIRRITEQEIIDDELLVTVAATQSEGLTPQQILSRVLQGLQDESTICSLSDGSYLLLDKPLEATSEDLPDEAIDASLEQSKLIFVDVQVSDAQAQGRQRRGTWRLRQLTLSRYGFQCALCDITNERLLVISHISRWSDDPDARGKLSNVICLCRFHDALFEEGYFSLSDDYRVLKSPDVQSNTIALVLGCTSSFCAPATHPPAAEYLHKHRKRIGFE